MRWADGQSGTFPACRPTRLRLIAQYPFIIGSRIVKLQQAANRALAAEIKERVLKLEASQFGAEGWSIAKRSPVGEEHYRPLLDLNAISQAVAPVSAPSADPAVRPPQQPSVVQDRVTSSSRPDLNPVQRRKLWRAVPAAPELAEKMDQEKRMLLTRRESEAVERLVSNMGCRLNTQLKLSHVLRAVVALLLNAEDQLDRRAGEALAVGPSS